MHELHPKFTIPNNENVIIWRYMPLSKFESVLERSALHFTKVSKFIDEGVLSQFNDLHRQEVYNKEQFRDEQQFQYFLKTIPYYMRIINSKYRELLLINCWHFSEDINEIMWKRYGDVAIQSTYRRLSDCFKNNSDDVVWIGVLDYRNIHNELMDESNTFSPFFVKGNSYSYEKELRVATCLPDDEGFQKVLSEADKEGEKISPSKKRVIDSSQLTDYGKFVKIDVNLLIEKIYVNRLTDSAFIKKIESLCYTHQVNAEIIKLN